MKSFLIILALFSLHLINAQEDCTNGIDDDGDGLIDLNDPDCQCFDNENYVFNGDFELYEELPVQANQLPFATGWMNPSNSYDIWFALPDYYHANSYSPIQTFPYPSGAGIVGIQNRYQIIGNGGAETYLDFYNEFFGAQLDQTLEPGKTYVFSTFVYRHNDNDDVEWPQLRLGLWGKNGDLRSYEIDFARCPDHHEEWTELTKVPFYPEKKWTKIEMEFTVEENISSIIIGLTCDLTFRYYNISGSKILAFDNVSISEKIEEFSIEASGAACAEDLVLYAQNTEDFIPNSYQWYYDGVAIAGETQAFLNMTQNMPEGYYSVRAMNQFSCRNSTGFAYIQPEINFQYQIDIDDKEHTVRLSDIRNQSNYTFSIDGINYQSSPVFTDVPNGEGFIYVKSHENCIVEKVPFVIFDVFNVITPNADGMNDTWVINGIEDYEGAHIKVFDRYGVQKFDYIIPSNLPKFEWNATNNGTPLASGEYWYHIKIKDNRVITGSLTIKRN